MEQNSGFGDFLNALDDAATDPAMREVFQARYARFLAYMLDSLFRAGIVAPTQTHPDPPEACDRCSRPMASVRWFVDGVVAEGGWSNQCDTCFLRQGATLGWGSGQLWCRSDLRADGPFFCVAGDRPVPPDPDDE